MADKSFRLKKFTVISNMYTVMYLKINISLTVQGQHDICRAINQIQSFQF